MQSNLGIASISLISKNVHDLDLLLRSGFLDQSNAIVLSQTGPGSEKQDLVFFVKVLFTRLQIKTWVISSKSVSLHLHNYLILFFFDFSLIIIIIMF
ncbi:hypothetical protein Dsin_002175 [Dipteronia sinensis]|uniref:Uncharacterized protein n=1 Tax=Dipteronia sinensis TaxID=43782 RepID=A0AAE0B6Q2_9ROSI|nr:hypothetical protein Dsin_002175 [Dipteronia sinensis]